MRRIEDVRMGGLEDWQMRDKRSNSPFGRIEQRVTTARWSSVFFEFSSFIQAYYFLKDFMNA